MARSKLGWGIIGCGVIGYWHTLAVLRNSEQAEVVAYCDAERERAEKFNQEYSGGQARTYARFEELVEDPRVDVVSVCTPSGLHLEPILAAARAGKHILCEKPIEIRLDRIDRIIDAVERAGVKLGVVFQRRTFEPSLKVKESLDRGVLGRLVLASAYLKYFRSRSYYRSGSWRGTWALDGGGALMNQGIHGIDLLLWLAGPVERVRAITRTLVHEIEVEDTAAALLEFQNGALGVIEGATSTNPGLPTRLELHGSEGTIIYEENRIVKWAVGGHADRPAEELALPPEEALPAAGKLSGKDLEALGHVRLVADLIESVREDRDPAVTAQEARRSVELILAIYESARTGKPVKLR